eukprot:scaffold4363_cov227-Alexandrium_tamarense.AAC.3
MLKVHEALLHNVPQLLRPVINRTEPPAPQIPDTNHLGRQALEEEAQPSAKNDHTTVTIPSPVCSAKSRARLVLFGPSRAWRKIMKVLGELE